MKHLKLFNDTTSYEAWKNSEDFVLPNVVFNEEVGMVYEPYVEPSSPNLVCVYDIVDISRQIKLVSHYAGSAFTSMIVDGVEMDFEYYYQFDTVGLHTVEFVLDDPTTISIYMTDYVSSIPELVSITIPSSVNSIGANFGVFPNIREFKGKFASDDGMFLVYEGKLFIAKKHPSMSGHITIPDGVTTIGRSEFSGCTNLTSVTIPDSVTEIGYFAFENCSGLTYINIPDSVTEIGYEAFYNCSSLTSVTIGNGVTKIEDLTFQGCSSLTSITIPNNVTSIGRSAFYGCTSLTSVTIPNSVTTIEDKAFAYCSSLTSVYCNVITPPTLGGSSVFDFNGSGRKIYVPTGSVDAYKSAALWSEYANDIVGYDFN